MSLKSSEAGAPSGDVIMRTRFHRSALHCVQCSHRCFHQAHRLNTITIMNSATAVPLSVGGATVSAPDGEKNERRSLESRQSAGSGGRNLAICRVRIKDLCCLGDMRSNANKRLIGVSSCHETRSPPPQLKLTERQIANGAAD